MAPLKVEVLIVGAGPAGATLAYELARSGIKVLLVDRAAFPRRKTCGGGVNLRTVRILPFDLSPVTEGVITGISFSRNLDDSFVRRYPEPLLITVSREEFDHFLVREAIKAGAGFMDKTRFLSLRQDDDGVRVETSSGAFETKFIAGADGANGVVAQKAEIALRISRILVMHSDVPASLLPDQDPDTVQIDWGSLKRGYAYFFPKKNSFAMGAGGYGLPSAQIKNYQRAFWAARSQKDEALPFSAAGFFLPLRRRRTPIHRGRTLLLGDAAGLVDPFFGEGIYSAVRSAQIAAPILTDALQNGFRTLHPYQDEIDRALMPELECSRLFREFFFFRPSFIHHKLKTSDRWWRAMARILRGERSNLDLKRKLGVLGSLLLRMAR